MDKITADDVRELNESMAVDPVMVQLSDGGIVVISGLMLHEHGNPTIIMDQPGLRSECGDWDCDSPRPDDYENLAELINDWERDR